jgi:hypothetical protein
VFTLSHLVQVFDGCFGPYTTGGGFAWGDLASLLVWGAACRRSGRALNPAASAPIL